MGRSPEIVALDIATAPRDGTVFIAIDSLGYPHIVWGDERGFFDERDGEMLNDVVWWSPVPTIPTSGS